MIGSLVAWLVAAIVVVAVVVWLLNWLYHRATKEQAYVRTGLGGERVVIDGGSLVLPIVHETVPVNLNVVRIPIERTRERAPITRDRMRVDIEAEFFVRVRQDAEAVAYAASTLGRRTLDPDALGDLLTAKFVGALRSAAATLSLDEMHERRSDFVAAVAELAAGALASNGLELESVAITDLDQTDLEHFNPANRFDAEGLTQLIESIESRRKARNDIEQSATLAIRTRNLEAEKAQLELERDSERSRLAQEQALEALRAEQRSEIARTRASREAESEQARMASERETREAAIEQGRLVDTREIEVQRALESARIEQEEALEAARLQRENRIERTRIDERHETGNAEIVAREDLERARIVSERQLSDARIAAEQDTQTKEIERGRQVERARIDSERTVEEARIAADRELEQARIERERELRRLEIEREKVLELASIERGIARLAKEAEEAEQRVQSEGARARAVEAEESVATVRERAVAERLAEVDRLIARKDADAATIAAEASRTTAEVAAEAMRLRHEAENTLSDDARATRLREHMIDRLEGIVRESVKPLENIDGIRILQVDGIAGSSAGGGVRSPTDEVIESALRYRAQAPLIDGMMKEIGIEGAGVAKMGDLFRSAKDAKSLAGATDAGADEATRETTASDDD